MKYIVRWEVLTVLQNITNHAEFIKVTATSFRTKGLLERDLNVTDGILVPRRIHGNVGEPQDEDVFYHFLPEVMIDTERLILRPVLLDRAKKLTRRIQVFAEGLLDNNSVYATTRDVAMFLEILGNGNEDTGGESKIEEAVALLGLVLGFDLFQVLVEVIKSGAVLVTAGNIRGDVLEFLNFGRDLRIIVGVLDIRGRPFVKLGLIHLGPRIADNFDISGKEILSEETKESGERLERLISMVYYTMKRREMPFSWPNRQRHRGLGVCQRGRWVR